MEVEKEKGEGGVTKGEGEGGKEKEGFTSSVSKDVGTRLTSFTSPVKQRPV